MRWLKVILITLMILCVPVNTISAVKKSKDVPPVVDAGALRYKDCTMIALKIYSLLDELDDLVIEFENIIINKDRGDKDFYYMRNVSHELKVGVMFLDHSTSILTHLIHIKNKYAKVFFNVDYGKTLKLMSLVNMGKTTIKVNLNFIEDKVFIRKTKEGLELIRKIQKLEEEFLERLQM